MSKVIHCRDAGVGLDCDFTAHGESDEEVMEQAQEHSRSKHGMDMSSDEMAKRMKKHIHEETAECPGCCA